MMILEDLLDGVLHDEYEYRQAGRSLRDHLACLRVVDTAGPVPGVGDHRRHGRGHDDGIHLVGDLLEGAAYDGQGDGVDVRHGRASQDKDAGVVHRGLISRLDEAGGIRLGDEGGTTNHGARGKLDTPVDGGLHRRPVENDRRMAGFRLAVPGRVRLPGNIDVGRRTEARRARVDQPDIRQFQKPAVAPFVGFLEGAANRNRRQRRADGEIHGDDVDLTAVTHVGAKQRRDLAGGNTLAGQYGGSALDLRLVDGAQSVKVETRSSSC